MNPYAPAPSTLAPRDTQMMEEATHALASIDPPKDLPDPDVSSNGIQVLERRYLRRDGER